MSIVYFFNFLSFIYIEFFIAKNSEYIWILSCSVFFFVLFFYFAHLHLVYNFHIDYSLILPVKSIHRCAYVDMRLVLTSESHFSYEGFAFLFHCLACYLTWSALILLRFNLQAIITCYLGNYVDQIRSWLRGLSGKKSSLNRCLLCLNPDNANHTGIVLFTCCENLPKINK